MKSKRQYLACAFATYTYHNDGPPRKAGDEVRVRDKDGNKVTVLVVAEVKKPNLITKPILNKKKKKKRDGDV
jgi:hypothetical protein